PQLSTVPTLPQVIPRQNLSERAASARAGRPLLAGCGLRRQDFDRCRHVILTSAQEKETMTIYYRDFKNIVIDGDDFISDFISDTSKSDTSKRRFFRRVVYEAFVVEQLNKVWGTWTGWAVLRGILDSGKTLTIVPFTAADKKGQPNAGAYVRP